MRPLVLTVVWFVLLAAAAFAWASVERRPAPHAVQKTAILAAH